jgi:flagellar hook-associated protein 3 FlgL
MTMRVPNLNNNSQALLDLQRIKQQFAETSQQLSSGKAIVNIADDPAGNAQVLNYQANIDMNSEYISQANTANSLLQSSSSVLTTMGNDLDRLLELGQEGLGSGASAASQAGIANEVDALRTNLISLGNTQVQGKYIFAGTNTTVVPFVDNATSTAVTYNGNGGSINLDVAPSVTVATNIPGSTLFFGAGGQGSATDILAQAAALRDALNANNTAAIQTAYNNLQSISTQLNVNVADLGDRSNGVTTAQSGLTAFNQTLTTLQSSVASVDYPTAVTQLNQESVAEQATLGTMAKSNQKTLFDYIA